MNQAIRTQMVIAEQVDFHEEEKMHSITRVRNAFVVPTLPAAAVTAVYVKFFFEEDALSLEPSIQVLDQDQQLVCSETLPPLKNFRECGMIPGMDTFLSVRFPVIEEGIYTYKLFLDEEVVAECYVSVFCQN